MQRILILILLACCFCSAAFLNIDIKDSRLQVDNDVYKPGGILGFATELGSHSDGEVSVSAWDIYIKPFVWSITVKRVMFEASVGFGYIIQTNNFNPEMKDVMTNGFDNWEFYQYLGHRSDFRYGYRLGYRITDQIMVSLVANYQYLWCGWYGGPSVGDHVFTGGWGLNLQWNIPWIPF